MRKSRFTEEQIAFALQQASHETPVAKHPQDGDLRADVLPLEEAVQRARPSELRRLRQLEEDNRKLKQMDTELSLDKHMLQEVLRIYV